MSLGACSQRKTSGFPILLLCLITAAACSHEADQTSPPPDEGPQCVPGQKYAYFQLPFQLDYRNTGNLSFSSTCDQLEGEIQMNNDFLFLKARVRYPASGMLLAFPESGSRLHTFEVPVQAPDEPSCPGGLITLSLSLFSRQNSSLLSGAVTACCGSEISTTRPMKILRLSGRLVEVEGLGLSK